MYTTQGEIICYKDKKNEDNVNIIEEFYGTSTKGLTPAEVTYYSVHRIGTGRTKTRR